MSCDPPNLNSFSAPVDFQLLFQSVRPFTKNQTFLYSDRLHKIFLRQDLQCNIKFQLNFSPAELEKYQIRAHLAYTDAEYEKEPIERCPLCKSKNLPGLAHVLCYEGRFQASHQQINGHYSVVIFPDAPASGNILEANYKFTCLSSHTTIRRRIVNLVFTLETRNEGRPVAQQKVRVKVSCTPGRDAINEEKKVAKEQSLPILPTDDMKTRVIKIIGPPAEVTSTILLKLSQIYNSFDSRSL